MKISRLFPFAIALFLTTCGGGSLPVLLNDSEQGVVVRYSQTSGDPDTAVAAADKFCAQYGRKAVQGDANVSTGDTFVSFACQKL